MMLDWIGWVATAIFTCSYFSKEPGTLRRIQALAALFWIGYGVLMHALPIIVANLVVAAVAIYSSLARTASVDRVNN
jgi:membrane-anchored glycerophosphoryl diester phosphodiesterase (GDPDase)